MNKFSALLVSAALITVGSSIVTIAHAEPKPAKPVVCMSYSEVMAPVDGEMTKVAICGDGKRPTILVRYSVITMTNGEGQTVKAIVGFRK